MKSTAASPNTPEVSTSIISGESRRYVKEWICVNERLMKVRLRVNWVWVKFIQAYAPTEDSERGFFF